MVLSGCYYKPIYTSWGNMKDHVMPKEKMGSSGTAVSGLLALISRAHSNFSLWHHQFIKAIYQERSTCGSEVMRFVAVPRQDSTAIIMDIPSNQHV